MNNNSQALQDFLAGSDICQESEPQEHNVCCPAIWGSENGKPNLHISTCRDRLEDDTITEPPRCCITCETGKKVAHSLNMVLREIVLCHCGNDVEGIYGECAECLYKKALYKKKRREEEREAKDAG